jgi:hypothetical protein
MEESMFRMARRVIPSACLSILMVATIGATGSSCAGQDTIAKTCGLSVENPHVSQGQARQGRLVIVAKLEWNVITLPKRTRFQQCLN